MIQIIGFMLFSQGIWAESLRLDHFFSTFHVDKGWTLVEVVGKLKGSGILVLMNGKPVVITNSHNLQGRKEASVTLPVVETEVYENDNLRPYTLTFKAKLPVILDNPLYDFSFLDLENKVDTKTYELLKQVAAVNGEFCNKTVCKKGWIRNPRSSWFNPRVAVVLDGKQTTFTLIETVSHKRVDDKIISGENDKIFSLPVYSRPGVSGGAFYDRGYLTGLLTKISLIGTPETYAMPFDVIGKMINQKENTKVKAYWNDGELSVEFDKNEIIVKSDTNGGGETGNGGGETGNGGGETGNGGALSNNYWTIYFNNPGSSKIMTWNPFVKRPSIFELNKESIAFFQTNNKYELPTLANYRWNYRHHKKQIPYAFNEKNLGLLEKARTKSPLDSAICGRISYYNNRTKTFYVEHGIQTTEADLGIFFVLPDINGRMPPRFIERGGPPKIFDIPSYWKDSSGWNRTTLTAARRTKGLLIDFINTEISLPKYGDPAPTGVHFTIDQNLLAPVITNQSGHSQTLKRTSSKSVSSLLYSNKDRTINVALLYETNNLKELERIYLQMDTKLIELGPCDSFVGVK